MILYFAKMAAERAGYVLSSYNKYHRERGERRREGERERERERHCILAITNCSNIEIMDVWKCGFNQGEVRWSGGWGQFFLNHVY